MQGYSPVEGGGVQRTEMHCHNCHKAFIAEIDYDVSGDHEIFCAHCDHVHCRTIRDGKITEARWDTRNGVDSSIKVSGRSVWKSRVIGAKSSSVSHFIRDAWLNRTDVAGD